MKNINVTINQFIRILLYFICCVIFLPGCHESKFELPDNFVPTSYNKKLDEIAGVKFKDEMQITVSLQASKKIKQSNFYGSAVMKNTFQMKFTKFSGELKGEDSSELSYYKVRDNLYIHRSFDFKSEKSNAYFEYGALCIKEPEEYYELYISGDKSKQNEHRDHINKFLESIINYHFHEIKK